MSKFVRSALTIALLTVVAPLFGACSHGTGLYSPGVLMADAVDQVTNGSAGIPHADPNLPADWLVDYFTSRERGVPRLNYSIPYLPTGTSLKDMLATQAVNQRLAAGCCKPYTDETILVVDSDGAYSGGSSALVRMNMRNGFYYGVEGLSYTDPAFTVDDPDVVTVKVVDEFMHTRTVPATYRFAEAMRVRGKLRYPVNTCLPGFVPLQASILGTASLKNPVGTKGTACFLSRTAVFPLT